MAARGLLLLGGVPVLAFALAACGTSSADDEEAVRERLEQWPAALAAGDVDTACDLFAKDTVVIWPGAEPRGWDQQCGALRDLIEEGEVAYRAPDVQEAIVDGDLATVRVVWTAVSAGDEGQVLEVENGVDVFERGADGVWRIHVSHAFPETG